MNKQKIKIAITGPESSGKTTLALALSRYFKYGWVKEYARYYLETGNKVSSSDDLVSIAKNQIELEEMELSKHNVIVCDTDMTVLKIWNEEKFPPLHESIQALFRHHRYHLTLLCEPDIKWVDDPLRENPKDRVRLFELFKKCLNENKVAYKTISGHGQKREDNAKEIIQSYFQLY